MKDKALSIDGYGCVAVLREVLACRASQIDHPGQRDCEGCPYRDQDGDCKDLEIMRDALVVIDQLDLFNKKVKELVNAGYSIELSRQMADSNKEEEDL